MDHAAQDTRSQGAGSVGAAIFAGIVFGTLLPAYLLFRLSNEATAGLSQRMELVALFVVVNVCAGGLVWKRSATLEKQVWRDTVRTLIIPWAMNVVLIALFLAADLLGIATK